MPKLRRAVAWLIDFALVFAAAIGLAVFTFHRISALVTDVPELGDKSAWWILTSRGDVIDTARHVWNESVLYVEQAFGILVLATFLYQWLCLTLIGRTLGKALAGMRVAPSTPSRAALRAGVSTAADVAVYSFACCLLVEGEFLLSVLCWLIAVFVFLANALAALTPTGRSLADRVAGTAVTGLGLPARPLAAA
ncbi:RDD family protein [Streptomyces sp. NPDC059009]|uniref:RDD family protein n=1 Tax=Streptomyces sp. NPDC059009 TaxID=3346694 RepID=UPI0036AED34D